MFRECKIVFEKHSPMFRVTEPAEVRVSKHVLQLNCKDIPKNPEVTLLWVNF